MFRTKRSLRKMVLSNLAEDFTNFGIEDTTENRLDYLGAVGATVDTYSLLWAPGQVQKLKFVISDLIIDIQNGTPAT